MRNGQKNQKIQNKKKWINKPGKINERQYTNEDKKNPEKKPAERKENKIEKKKKKTEKTAKKKIK